MLKQYVPIQLAFLKRQVVVLIFAKIRNRLKSIFWWHRRHLARGRFECLNAPPLNLIEILGFALWIDPLASAQINADLNGLPFLKDIE